MTIASKTSRPLTKWQIIRRFQAVLRRFRSEGKLTLGEAHALAVLPEFMGDDGAMFPSHEAMAEKSGACRRTVINALNRAYALGIVKHTPRYVYDQALGKRVRTSNAYEIVLSALHQVAQAARFLMRSVRNHLSARPAHERPLSSHQPRDMKTGNSSFWVDTKWGARQPATIRVEGICLLPC